MVGDWQLQKTLGAGSMGKVKLATNVNTREKVSPGVRQLSLVEFCDDVSC
jgi:serine/threonine protein kinase